MIPEPYVTEVRQMIECREYVQAMSYLRDVVRATQGIIAEVHALRLIAFCWNKMGEPQAEELELENARSVAQAQGLEAEVLCIEDSLLALKHRQAGPHD